MRSIFLLALLAIGTASCTAPAEQVADTTAASQPKPGTVTARMNGQYGWYGTIGSQNR